MSSGIFDRIIRAGVGVFCLLSGHQREAKSGNRNLFLHILPFFLAKHGESQGKKSKMRRKRFRLPDFALRVPKSEGYLKSDFSGSQKRGDEGVVKRAEVVRECTGAEGERGGRNEEKGWEERGPKHTRKTLILVPL